MHSGLGIIGFNKPSNCCQWKSLAVCWKCKFIADSHTNCCQDECIVSDGCCCLKSVVKTKYFTRVCVEKNEKNGLSVIELMIQLRTLLKLLHPL